MAGRFAACDVSAARTAIWRAGGLGFLSAESTAGVPSRAMSLLHVAQ